MMPAIVPMPVSLYHAESPLVSQKPWLAETAVRRTRPRFGCQTKSARAGSDPGRNPPRCAAAKQAGALDNNNESASASPSAMRHVVKLEGSELLKSFGKTARGSRCSAACADDQV